MIIANSYELTVSNKLFEEYSTTYEWKIELSITSYPQGQTYELSGTASSIYVINKPPYNGACDVDKQEGIALLTYFTISCLNWVDDDGFITRYEFSSIF